MSQASTLATSYHKKQQEHLRRALNGQVERVVVTAIGSTTVTVNTYDGNFLGTFPRIKGTRPSVGEEGYVLNITGDPKHPGWLYIGSVGGFQAFDVYRNAWSSDTETSTTNSATPVTALSQTWALPAGTYTLVITGQAGMRNNGSTDNKGYLAIRIDGTIINSSTIGIATSAGAEPVVRTPVSVAGSIGGKSGSVLIELIFRNDPAGSSTISCWCYCPLLSVSAQRTS